MTTHEPVERNRRNVERFLLDTHSGRFEVIDEVVHPGIVTHGFPGGRNPRSREEYKTFFASFDRAFPSMDFTIDAIVAQGDKVAARWSIAAVHAGAWGGFEPSGCRVQFDGMVIYRMVDGQIAETWLYPDAIGLMRQLAANAAAAADDATG